MSDRIDIARPSLDAYPPLVTAIPDVHEESGRYALGFARNQNDLKQIQRMRFEVFNLEMGEGLDASYATLRDEDSFDRSCHHMLVRDTKTAEVVGTYRMQGIEMAGAGFYSAGEFDLSALESGFLPRAVELGRACIARKHRNSRVLFLLWRGLAAYMRHNDKRYFFGCCSLTSQDQDEGLRVYRHLEKRGKIDPAWRVRPRTGYECVASADDTPTTARVKIPRLMRTYLQYGARIAGPPAIDRLFKTIDFLAVFDMDGIDERIRRMFVD